MKTLEGKVAVITGGSSGIGLAPHISGKPTTIRGHSVEGADIVERNG